MSKECITDCKLEETGFNYTMSLIQGKYKMFILYTLSCFEIVRFNEMQKYIGTITFKTLSSTLKQLEADGLINRKEYPFDLLQRRYGLPCTKKTFRREARKYVRILAGLCGFE